METVSKLIDTVVEVAGQKDLLIAPGQNTRWTYKELAVSSMCTKLEILKFNLIIS